MKKILLALAISLFGNFLYSQTTQTYTYTGSVQTFSIPPCVTSLTIVVRGAQGTAGTSTAGTGGSAQGIYACLPGQILNVYVGGQAGYNGGGTATTPGGNGGGASDIRTSPYTLSDRIIVAGGGGGGGSTNTSAPGGAGGGGTAVGTNFVGGAGGIAVNAAPPPAGGSNGGTNGGVGGVYVGAYGGAGGGGGLLSGGGGGTNTLYATGGTGSLGIGGNGGGPTGAAGGGGGYYGGGGASGGTNSNAGGGGGSSWTGTLSSPSFTAGGNIGNGLVLISYVPNGSGILASTLNPSICIGSTTTLTASNVSSYTWSPGGSNSTSIIVSPTSNTTYTVQGTNSFGCITTSLLAVKVETAVPTLSIATTANTVCLNQPVTITAGGAYTYTWTNGITNGSPYLPSATGVFTVTGTNACGISTSTSAITVNPLPSITASVNNPTVCNGSSIILNGGGSVAGYTWTNGAPNNSAFVPSNTNNYTVTGVGANGCTNTAVAGVTVLVTPTITPVVTPTAICFGGTASLSASGATGYTWTPGNIFIATPTVSPIISTTYTVFRTNGACSSSSTVNLVVNPLPLVGATASPSQICAGASINLNVVGPITNTWLPGGFTSANLNVYPNFSTTYTVTGSNGSCTATSTVPIIVNPSPTISIASSTNIICQGNSSTLTISGVGPLTYTWGGSGNTNPIEVVSPASTTIITVSASNAFNCVSSLNQLIQVNPVPNMSLASTVPFVCSGDMATLSVVNQSANVLYTWNGSTVAPSVVVSPIVTTNYAVTGINSLTGCQNSNTITLAVYIATFAVISPSAICKGQTATLTAVGQATAYTWTGNLSGSTVTVSPVINTTYNVTGTTGSCSSQTTVPVIVNPIPPVTAVATKGQICKFEISTITANGATSYSWNTGATTPVISFTLAVTTNYTLTGTDLNGCAKTVTVSQFVATCIGIENIEMNGNAGINVYPNPNNGNFTVSSDVNVNLNIVNTLGQVVGTISLKDENKKEIAVSNLSNGIYFITGKANGINVNKKIIVER